MAKTVGQADGSATASNGPQVSRYVRRTVYSTRTDPRACYRRLALISEGARARLRRPDRPSQKTLRASVELSSPREAAIPTSVRSRRVGWSRHMASLQS